MTKDKFNKDEKAVELVKYRDLVLATIDYCLDKKLMGIKTSYHDPDEHFNHLKKQTIEHFHKGRLTRLKQWFRDLIEMPIECVDLEFNRYLQNKTNYNIDIFKSYYQRVDKVIEKGKITSDDQFYDIHMMIGQLCKIVPVDKDRIVILNKLLGDYEQCKSRQKNLRQAGEQCVFKCSYTHI